MRQEQPRTVQDDGGERAGQHEDDGDGMHKGHRVREQHGSSLAPRPAPIAGLRR
jgi:hypothetical protein